VCAFLHTSEPFTATLKYLVWIQCPPCEGCGWMTTLCYHPMLLRRQWPGSSLGVAQVPDGVLLPHPPLPPSQCAAHHPQVPETATGHPWPPAHHRGDTEPRVPVAGLACRHAQQGTAQEVEISGQGSCVVTGVLSEMW